MASYPMEEGLGLSTFAVCACVHVCVYVWVCLRILREEKKKVGVLVRCIMSYATIECCLVLFLFISCVG